ncbi:expressed unknown protein [Seminavis robusta]|uniref:VWFA domain-containing protein n=1 Tax=Seminavis robusta TaxID=568900 RepID=A0A9N8HGP6_9STRA|nr:expressed unknown protein [Seminavis robusta]|eukprot:Sro589_g171690.1 n/a (386) ;mRNA; f:16590-17830
MTKSYDNVPVVLLAEPVDSPNNNRTNNLALAKKQNTNIDEEQLERLVEQGYSRGLAESLTMTKAAFGQRIWIIDNSGSMNHPDGHRIVPTLKKGDVKMVPCSRWEEIQECVKYHIAMAGAIEASTYFRLLNNPGARVGPQQFSVADSSERIMDDVREAQNIIRNEKPHGCTPLTSHILEIHREIKALAPELRQNGQRVTIVIATDGLPTDQRGHGGDTMKNEFVEALRMLEGLPVWVVIRLCTDEDKVVEFYNDLDVILELSVEVLDDFTAEAQEVYECNPWLNYALPIHRMREMGFHDRVFDMLDERLLTKSELRDFCYLLFGESNFDGVPDPSLDWTGFIQNVEMLLQSESLQWNPISKRMKPWISVKKLNRCYGSGASCVIM